HRRDAAHALAVHRARRRRLRGSVRGELPTVDHAVLAGDLAGEGRNRGGRPRGVRVASGPVTDAAVTESIGRQAGRGLRFSLAGTLLTKLGSFAMGRLVLANSAGLVVNAVVAITLAATGAGAFSFAWGQVTGAAMTGLLVFLFGRVPFRYGFDRAIARKLLVFGVPLAASLGVE